MSASSCMSKEEALMAHGNLNRLFFTFSLPGMCGILFISLQTLTDGLLLGHFAGASAMAAINVALPCFSFLLAISIVVAVGCETVMSIALGRNDVTTAQEALTTATLLGGSLASVWAVIVLAYAPSIAAFAGADATLLPYCTSYLRTLAPFFPFVTLIFIGDYALKSLGRPLYAMSVLSAVVVINVALDVLFIAVWGWHVTGAALATGISYAAGCVADFMPLCRGRFRVALFRARPCWSRAKAILACGSAEGLSECAGGVAIMLFNIVLMRHAGATGVAAFTMLNYMLYVALALYLGMADGLRPIMGYNHGSHRPDRVQGILRRGLYGALLIGCVLGTVLFTQGDRLLKLFFSADDAGVASMATSGSRIVALAMVLEGFNILIIGFFTSVGKPRVAGALAVLRSLVLVAVGLAILPAIWGLDGIWMVMPLSEGLAMLAAIWLLQRERRAPLVSSQAV